VFFARCGKTQQNNSTFSASSRDIHKLVPITEYTLVYDNLENVSQLEYRIYIDGELSSSKGTIDVYYDNKPATGKFLNLLRFAYYYQDDESIAALFSENNWTRSYANNSGPSERKLDLEYDENGNATKRFYGFTDIKWECK
jgi:hypothetical protein